jgi:FtsP/CotA-like multicopper oxidase with cupredoxin domain
MIDATDIPGHTAIAAPRSRRLFLRDSAFAAVAAGVATACGRPAAAAPAVRASATPAAPPPPSPAQLSASMDALCEAGTKAFPAKTEGRGNVLLAPQLDGHVKVFDLTARKTQWETTPGQRVEAWTYNGTTPGPQIRVREGDRVRVVLHNELDQSTTIHFHGLELPNDQDGVPFITQPPVKPGETHTYEFTAPNPGSHMYHSHYNATTQVMKGLLGAFIIEPKDMSSEPHSDIDFVMVLNDGLSGYTLNGKGFPATEPIVAEHGQVVRIRFMNEGMLIHPMHLHGMHMTVIAKDGWPQPAPWRCDTLNIAPGERWDVLVKCTNPGTWAFHCHILPHAESEQGMYGMVTALIVTPKPTIA